MPTTIVLLHGAALNARMWDPALAILTPEFVVLAPDLPGHGNDRREPFSFGRAVGDVSAMIERESPGGAIVAGDSLGGYVAMALAAAHPAFVTGLVAGGCTGGYGWVARVGSTLRHALVGAMGPERARSGVAKQVRKVFPKAPLDAIMQGGVELRAHKEAVTELVGRRFAGGVARWGGPMLVVNGELDRPMRRGEPGFLRAIPGAELVVFDGSPHGVSLHDPERFALLVRDFARRVPAD